jgi:hypothetical protein
MCILTLDSLSLRPTDEIGEDGWHFSIFGHDLDLTKVAESEELIFETIASVIPTEITFNKLVWVSMFTCVLFCYIDAFSMFIGLL